MIARKKGLSAALAGIAVAVALAVTASGCATGGRAGRSWDELGMMSDPVLDQVLLFYLGESWAGLTDTAECLETAARVDVKDPYSWAREWRATAERLDRAAAATEAAGHGLSAGELYLRASSYYRAALHRHMEPYAPEVKELTVRELSAFASAIRLLGMPAERVSIPFEGSALGAYFFASPVVAGPAPTVIVHQGRDAWAEDCLYLAREANRRGYHALLVDGPGQGSTLRLTGMPLRPDWETVVAAAIDWLEERPEVDRDAIGLMGLSMGGALAPRAAARERRVAFLVANPGVLSWSDTMFATLEEMSPMIVNMYERNPAGIDSLMKTVARLDPFMAWGMVDTMWKHGVTTASALFDEWKRYDATEDAPLIACPVLVIDGEAEEYGQAPLLYAALTGPKTYLLFTEDEAASHHVQVGAISLASQRVFDWIDDTVAGLKAGQ